jgi:hypothetical protein
MLGTAQLKTAIVRKLRAQFRTAAVPYIPPTWNTIIQAKPIASTPYPYISLEIDSNDIKEVDVTATGSSYDYFVGIKTVVRSESNYDTRETRDAMVAEIQRILDVDYDEYINILSNGYNVYIQTVESVLISEENQMGTDFYVGDVMLKVRMESVGSQTAPAAEVALTYSDFHVTPQNSKFEINDTGNITLPVTYPPSNGWVFQSVEYSLASDSDGTIVDNVVNVASGDDFIAIVSVITFESAIDGTTTTTVFSRSEVTGIKSPRIGVLTNDVITSEQISNLPLWAQLSFPIVDPDRVNLEIDVNANEYIYILVDELYTLTGIKNDLGLDDIEEFVVSTHDGYRVYRVDTAIATDGARFEYTLISGATNSTPSSIGTLSVNVKTVDASDASLVADAINIIPAGTTGLIMSLPANPATGAIVHVSNLSGNIDNEIALNGNILQGQYSDNLVLDDATSSFSLIFVNITLGWNIIGQN